MKPKFCQSTLVIALASLSFLETHPVHSAVPQVDVSAKESKVAVETMRASDFAIWIGSTKRETVKATEGLVPPESDSSKTKMAEATKRLKSAENALLNRFESDRQVTDASISDLAEAWSELDRIAARIAKSEVQVNEQLFRYINLVLPWLSDRPLLKSAFVERQMEIMHVRGKDLEVLTLYGKHYPDVDKVRDEANVLKLRMMHAAANSAFKNGQKQVADDLFQEASHFPWYSIPGEAGRMFRDYYVVSLKGLIRVREGNLKQLKNIYPYPAVKNEIAPILEAAINAAKE